MLQECQGAETRKNIRIDGMNDGRSGILTRRRIRRRRVRPSKQIFASGLLLDRADLIVKQWTLDERHLKYAVQHGA